MACNENNSTPVRGRDGFLIIIVLYILIAIILGSSRRNSCYY